MSNYRTMVKRIAGEIQRGNMDTEIKLCIIDAIEFFQSEEDRFNEDAWSFLTVAGVAVYKFKQVPVDTAGIYVADDAGYLLVTSGGSGTYSLSLPHDWLSPIGPVWLHISDDDNNYVELENLTYEEGDRSRYQAGSSTSYPDCVYWEPDGLRLVPPPTLAGHRISGRYKKRVWVPTASWNGTAWTFDSLDSTSEWFRHSDAERLIRAKAKELIYERYIDDVENLAVTKAAVSRLLQDKRLDDSEARATNQISPWGF